MCIILIIESKHRESFNMTNANFKTYTQTMIELELLALSTIENAFNVNNQFYESILESALENLNNDNAVEAAYEMFDGTGADIMSVAHYLSTFYTPEISEAWSN